MARPTAAPPKDVTRILKPLLLAQSLGVVLTPLNTSFNGHTGISHHQPWIGGPINRTPNDYLYSGERFDPAAGAYHLRERYYNPQRGRFLTTDPFPGFLEEPPTQNDYSYVGGDPANLVDPSGLTETFEKVYLRAQIAIRPALPCIRAIPSNLVRSALPTLIPKLVRTFDGPVRTRMFKPGDKIYRSPWPPPQETRRRPGPWFGTRRTTTSAGTESLYNVKKYGNPVNRLRTFVFTKEVTVYYGKVTGGKGYQVLFPKDITSL